MNREEIIRRLGARCPSLAEEINKGKIQASIPVLLKLNSHPESWRRCIMPQSGAESTAEYIAIMTETVFPERTL